MKPDVEPTYIYKPGQGWVVETTRQLKTLTYGHHHRVSMDTKCVRCGAELGSHAISWERDNLIVCRSFTSEPFVYE